MNLPAFYHLGGSVTDGPVLRPAVPLRAAPANDLQLRIGGGHRQINGSGGGLPAQAPGSLPGARGADYTYARGLRYTFCGPERWQSG